MNQVPQEWARSAPGREESGQESGGEGAKGPVHSACHVSLPRVWGETRSPRLVNVP